MALTLVYTLEHLNLVHSSWPGAPRRAASLGLLLRVGWAEGSTPPWQSRLRCSHWHFKVFWPLTDDWLCIFHSPCLVFSISVSITVSSSSDVAWERLAQSIRANLMSKCFSLDSNISLQLFLINTFLEPIYSVCAAAVTAAAVAATTVVTSAAATTASTCQSILATWADIILMSF